MSDKAKELGADALFNQILPLLMSPTLEVQIPDNFFTTEIDRLNTQNIEYPFRIID